METPITPSFSDCTTLTCICEGCQVKLEYDIEDTYPLEDGLCYHCIYGYEDDLYDIERDMRADEEESK